MSINPIPNIHEKALPTKVADELTHADEALRTAWAGFVNAMGNVQAAATGLIDAKHFEATTTGRALLKEARSLEAMADAAKTRHRVLREVVGKIADQVKA
jgi:hypothetical protein